MKKTENKFDESVRPQDDFFGYVNNIWIANNPIPDSESRWGQFNLLRDKSAESIRKIIDDLQSADVASLSFDQKLIKVFFNTANNYADFSGSHLSTLSEELRKIADIKNKRELSKYLGYAHRINVTPFWTTYVSVDDKNSSNQIFRIHQSGLLLPDRDYYLNKSAHMKSVRKKYEQYFHNCHKLLPTICPDNFDSIMRIETRLATAQSTEAEMRDIEKNYHKFSFDELKSRFPDFDWDSYFSSTGWSSPDDNIVIDQLSFVQECFSIIGSESIDDIRDYLIWQLVDSVFGWINADCTVESFEFYGKVISGKVEDRPIWKRSIILANDTVIGELLGREYVARHFPESSKQAVLQIVDDLKIAYQNRIESTTWMSAQTKQLARNKLNNIEVLIGYPDTWKSFDKLQLQDDNHIANLIALQTFFTDINLAKIGKHPDKNDWQMNAHQVNAYCDFNLLVICFPAGILQRPFFDPNASYATNLGGIGTVIGHELSHNFDDQGSEFDESGNLNKWMSKSEQKSFKALTKNVILQADKFEILPGIMQIGKMVAGEVIADIIGVELAVAAQIAKNSDASEMRDLFVNYATFECSKERKESLIQSAKTDVHPVSEYRVNGVLPHIDEFYDAFDVKPSDKLYILPDQRAQF